MKTIRIPKPEIGTVQGKLVVIGHSQKALIVCRCLCGAEIEVSAYRFLAKGTKQCRACYNASLAEKPYGDIAGRKFGLLTAVSAVRKPGSRLRWDCVCDCGGRKLADGAHLRAGHVSSCGCLINTLKFEKHGMYKTPEYRAWSDAKGRCYNQNNRKYPIYGGRGITMCERWRRSFEAFIADMGLRPSSAYSIDRIDGDGNYEPSNCRWATIREQNNNTSFNRVVTIDGQNITIAEAVDLTGLSRCKIERADNMGAAVLRVSSRYVTPPLALRRGSQSPRSKLSEVDVLAIRDDTRSSRIVAAAYGISGSQVRAIRLRVSWSWLP